MGILDKRAIDHELRCIVGELKAPPGLHLTPHWLKIALYSINANGQRILQVEMLRVLGKHRREVAVERHVVTHKNPKAHCECEAHGFVVRVADSERETRLFKGGFQIKNAEQLHAIVRAGIAVAALALVMLTGLVDPKLRVGSLTAPLGLEAREAVRVTLPVKPPAGVTVMVEVFPEVAPGRTLTAVPLTVKLGGGTVTVTDVVPVLAV